MEEERKYVCWKCQTEIDQTVKVSRQDSCPVCDADLRVCKNCRFWDPSYHNECRENSSYYIRDREKANFCGAFELRSVSPDDRREADDARAKLEALFKKK